MNKPSMGQGEIKGETRIKWERGNYCCEGERRANNQAFRIRVRVSENTVRHLINYASSQSRRERRGAPCSAAAAFSTLSCSGCAGKPTTVRDKVKVQADIRFADRRDPAPRCRV